MLRLPYLVECIDYTLNCLFYKWPKACSEFSKSARVKSCISSSRLYNNHVKDTLRVKISKISKGQVRALCVACCQWRSKNMTSIFFVHV